MNKFEQVYWYLYQQNQKKLKEKLKPEFNRQIAVLKANGYDYKVAEMLERDGYPMPTDYFNEHYGKKWGGV